LLAILANWSDLCRDCVINAKGATMNAPSTEEPETTQSSGAKPHKKPPSRERRGQVASAKVKPGRKAGQANKAPKGGKNAHGGRDGSKTAQILDLLKRPGGVTSKELMKVTGWQAHSVRGFLSGTVGKKMGLAVTSVKGEDGERGYSVKG
jgi:Protein of unknown function (DUF3489)